MGAKALAGAMDRFQGVDVRYRNEWKAGHIDGAVHLPVDYVYERFGETDAGRPMVTVCLSGTRSAEAAKDLAGEAGEGFDVESLGERRAGPAPGHRRRQRRPGPYRRSRAAGG